MFRSFDSGSKLGEKINNVLPALYIRSLATVTLTAVTSSQEPILSAVPAAFTFRRTSETAGSRSTTVLYKRMFGRLVINSNGDIFAGTYFGGGVFRSTDYGDSWTPVNNGQNCGNIWSLAINSSGTIFAGTAGCGDGMYRSTDNGDTWTLANTD